MKIKSTAALTILGLLVLTSCTRKAQLRKILIENPDILVEAMDKNPEKFAEVLSRMTARSRQMMEAKNAQMEQEQREQEFKNPKVIEIESSRAVSGSNKAPITIVAFSDFECPYCKRGFETLSEVQKKHGEEIRFVFKHFPLPFHSMARPAAEYFEAIAIQSPKKAYLFHDEIFTNQPLLVSEKEKFLEKAAKKVGADMSRLKSDLKSNTVRDRIQKDIDEGQKLGVRGTPKFFINGISLNGAKPVSDFESVIARLKK